MLYQREAKQAPTLRLLIVSYQFPPAGGVGVGRVLKLCKYLPDYGVEPTVLTVSNPSVPLRDEALGDDARGVHIVRVPTLEPDYRVKRAAWSASASGSGGLRRALMAAARALLVPDPQILWQPSAQLALPRLLRSGVDVVFVSGPPFSQFLLAPIVRLFPGAAVVLDYRDEWSTYRASFEMMGKFQAVAGDLMEPALVRTAHAITTATEPFRQELLRRFPKLEPGRVIAVPNGFDPDDFPRDLPEPPRDRFVLTYAGTVYALNRAPGLLEAIRRLHRDEPELAKLLRVRFIGRVVETELPSFEGLDELGVELVGFLPKSEALRQQAQSHLLLSMFDEAPGTERMYAAKIFEIMYLRRPCLVLAPQGVMTELAWRHRLGPVAGPRDPDVIARILERALRRFRDGAYEPRTDPQGIERYHRRAIAGEFARVFREATAHAA